MRAAASASVQDVTTAARPDGRAARASAAPGPALAVEGGGFWETCRRAWKLTRGTFWRVLGIYLLTSVILGIIGQVVAVPVGLLMSVFMVMESGAGLAVSYGVTYVITGGMSVLFLGGVIALLYIDTRMRREGLDVQLQAAAAAAADK